MVDIFTEIQEDLRRDRMLAFWSRWGSWVVAAVLAFVIAVAAVVGWREWQARQNAANSITYSQALQRAEAGDTDQALAALADLRTETSGYGVLAQLRSAALLAAKGDRAGAIAAYDALAKASGAEKVYRDLATIRAVMLQLDDGDTAALIARLAPLIAPGSPWQPSARELTALLERRAGNVDRARTLFQELIDDPASPPALRQRAGEMLATLGPKAG